jgi:hypothetical protein
LATTKQTILGITPKKLAIGGAATTVYLAGKAMDTSSQASWAGLDNVMGSSNVMIRDIKNDLGRMSPEERIQAIKDAEQAYGYALDAEDVVTESTNLNPQMWPQAKAWRSGVAQTRLSIERNLEYIKNYDPYMDQWSNESRGQRY